MDTNELIVAIAGGTVAFIVIWLWQKWATKRLANRLVADVLAETTTPDGRPKLKPESPKLKPESDYTVAVSEADVICSRPDGTTESVEWNDLQRVEILTTDDGPFAPDMFWVLYGSTGGCVIPWGATGENELMDRLQALPDFRNDVIVNAASLTTNNQLLCWERTPQNA